MNNATKTICALALVLVFGLCITATPATADYDYAGWPAIDRVNGTVNGSVFFDYEP